MPALLVPSSTAFLLLVAPVNADPIPVAAPAPTVAPAPAPSPAAAPASTTTTTTTTTTEEEPVAHAVPAPAATDWDKRIRATHEMPSAIGATGLLHLPGAMTAPAGTFHVSFTGDWFKSSGFLCTASYPCGTGATASTNDTANHVGATIVLSASLFEGFETYVALRAYANSDDQGQPQLLQVLGDTTLGIKYARRLGDTPFHFGGLVDLLLLNGTGGLGLAGSGTSLRLGALATAALDELQNPIPVRFHVSATYTFDNSGALVSDVEAQRDSQITRIERYGLGINKVDNVMIGLGVEGLLVDDHLRPFLEYTVNVPYNRQNYICSPPTTLVGGGRSDECLEQQGFGSFPSRLSFGTRYFPFTDGGFRGLSFLGALDIGVTGVSTPIAEMAQQAPYTIWLGLALSTDTVERPPVQVEKIVEKKVEVEVGTSYATIKGVVHEQGTNTPIAGAIITYVGTVRSPLGSQTDGTFSDEVPPGAYQLSIKADGYKEGTCGGTATAPAKKTKGEKKPLPTVPGAAPPPAMPAPAAAGTGVLELDCALEALPKVGTVVLTIMDTSTSAGMPNVTVTIKEPSGLDRTLTSDANGIVKLENVVGGTWQITVDTPGYLVTHQSFEVEPRDENKDKILVRPQPKEKDRLVVVDKGEVKIKEQILFAFDKADILPESAPLLEEIADVLIRTPRLHKIQIQGHTDNSGTKEHNQFLSEQRAESVRAFLVRAGVDPSRFETKGFGDTKPIGPNATEAGRKKNRRVQFIILEQDPAPKTK
jgi:outer membrane protein OmpA-like peptidoglycan-associated protein